MATTAHAAAAVPTPTPQKAALPKLPFHKVVVAVDFQKQTAAVLQAALAVAGCFRSELIFVHAAYPAAELSCADPIAADVLPLELEAAKAKLAETIRQEPWLACYRHHEVVSFGDPVQLIEEVAFTESADLVITGSHAAKGLERLALGSVAESIMRHVACPVLIVGPSAKVDKALFRTLLLAADLRDPNSRAAQLAFAATAQFTSALYMVHAIDPKRRHEAQPELLESTGRLMLERLVPPALQGSPDVRYLVEHGQPADTVVRVAGCKRSSLILAGVNQRSNWEGHSPWSTLSAIVRDAPCPVLVVRD